MRWRRCLLWAASPAYAARAAYAPFDEPASERQGTLRKTMCVQEYFEFEGGLAARARGLTPETSDKMRQWLKDNQ